MNQKRLIELRTFTSTQLLPLETLNDTKLKDLENSFIFDYKNRYTNDKRTI